ncbi:hypothetical protein AKO1_003618, partial [Acrasis kona]
MLHRIIIVSILVVILHAKVQLDKISLPEGWNIDLLATIPDARQMTINKEQNILIVGSRYINKVHAVVLYNKFAGTPYVLADNLNAPNGVAFDDESGSLYVALIDRIVKYDNIVDYVMKSQPAPTPIVVYDKYPNHTTHGYKYIKIHNGRIFVPQGTPCDRCVNTTLPDGSITSIKMDGSDFTVHAQGIRNSVGLDFHPISGDLWFTDMDSTHQETEHSEDELNSLRLASNVSHIPHFGYPYCYSTSHQTLPDPDFNPSKNCSAYIRPSFTLGSSVAALGCKFYSSGTNNKIPEQFKSNDLILIAEHGSLNGTTGFKISKVNITGSEKQVFVEGWLESKTGVAWGRPVDVLVLNDGSILVSDDLAGAIYRIYHVVSTQEIKLWAYITFPILFIVALSLIGCAIFFFNRYQSIKESQASPQGEKFEEMKDE